MSALGPHCLYRFGLFEVDSHTGELRKQGMRLRVRGRPIDILLCLLERPGEVVARDDLRSRLWTADTFVDFDHGLNSAVNRLREALGDSAENPRFIETLPRRGYRFLAPVTQVAVSGRQPAPIEPEPAAQPPAPPAIEPVSIVPPVPSATRVEPPTPIPAPAHAARSAGRNVWIAGAVVLALAVAAAFTVWRPGTRATSRDRMTIAVLPFENLSGSSDQDYFSDGFTEEMIAALGMLDPTRLRVIGRTTSMLYKGASKSIGQIGQELGVTYVLEGSVRRAGTRVRITSQLVDTTSMTNLWSDTYERNVDDVLTIQAEVARQIASSLALALAPDRAVVRSTPASFEAQELFMRGRFFREQATEQGARTAIEYYQKAIAADGQYAAAYAAVADAYRLLGAPGWEAEAPAGLLSKAKEAAERALSLDPRSPEARAVLAMIKMNFDWDLEGAEREIKEALRLNPSFAQAHQYYSGILTPMARQDDALASARRAVELDPMSATAGTSLGVRYYYANKPSEAIAEFTRTLEFAPGFSVAHWGLAQCYRLQGRFDAQLDQLRSAVQLSGNSAYMRAHLAYGYAVAGDRARAEALRREIEAEGPSRYVAPYHLALIAAGLGETGDAIKWLERAFADRSGWLVFLAVEPEFDNMRQVPEFQQLLQRVKRR
jgi:TolB-like protein/DNA-binding winged helix-turn-helix (wHTH) protein